MKRRMAFLDRNENTVTSRADFSAGTQGPFNGRTFIRKIDNARR